MPDILVDPDPTVPAGMWRTERGGLVQIATVPLRLREAMVARRSRLADFNIPMNPPVANPRPSVVWK